jgi:hypothetical protein
MFFSYYQILAITLPVTHKGRFAGFQLFNSWWEILQYLALAMSQPARTEAAGSKNIQGCYTYFPKLLVRHTTMYIENF